MPSLGCWGVPSSALFAPSLKVVPIVPAVRLESTDLDGEPRDAVLLVGEALGVAAGDAAAAPSIVAEEAAAPAGITAPYATNDLIPAKPTPSTAGTFGLLLMLPLPASSRMSSSTAAATAASAVEWMAGKSV